MNETKCPRCGEPITDDELRALWGQRNGRKTSEAKRAGALKASQAAAEKKRAMKERQDA